MQERLAYWGTETAASRCSNRGLQDYSARTDVTRGTCNINSAALSNALWNCMESSGGSLARISEQNVYGWYGKFWVHEEMHLMVARPCHESESRGLHDNSKQHPDLYALNRLLVHSPCWQQNESARIHLRRITQRSQCTCGHAPGEQHHYNSSVVETVHLAASIHCHSVRYACSFKQRWPCKACDLAMIAFWLG